MSYKKLAIFVLALALIFPQINFSEKQKTEENKPNILIVTIDTLRADRVRCYGYKKIKTPAMDQLSQEGVLFEDVSCPVPLTLPSHASIFTGLYPFSHGIRYNFSFILGWEKLTTADILRQQGYKTAAFVASSILDSKFGLDRGFETYDDNFGMMSGPQREFFAEKKASAVAQSALEWLERNKEQRFFLWVHFYDPHDPYIPPEPFRSQYKENPYDGEVAYADAVLGDVFTKLKDLGLYQNTLIIVTSDHGEGLGDHKEEDHGFFVYESTLRVPLIFFWQGKMPKGKRIKVPVRLIDIHPTVLDFLDIPITGNIQGKSLKPFILGREGKGYNPKGELSYAESYYARLILNWSELRTLREGNWKYIEVPRPELYDLSSDPKELKNLYSAKKNIALKLKAKLEEIAGAERAALRKPEQKPDPELLAKLESLGYLGGVHPKASEKLPTRVDPKDKIEIWNKLFYSLTLMRMNRNAEAIENFHQLLKQDPENLMALENLGKCYYLSTNYDKAIETAQKVLDQKTESAKSLNIIGLCYERKRAFNKAIQFQDRALEISPYMTDALISKGRAYFEMENYDKSEEIFKKALVFDPKNTIARFALASIDTRRGQIDLALKKFQEMLSENIKHPDIHKNIANIYLFNKQQIEKAIYHLEEVLKVQPNDEEVIYNLALVYYQRGQKDLAEKYFKKSVEIKPDLFESHLYLGRLLADRREIETAISEYNLALKAKPDYVQLYFLIGEAYQLASQPQKAIESYTQFLEKAKEELLPIKIEAQRRIKAIKASLN